MRFKLTATTLMHAMGDPDDVQRYLGKYIEKIKNADSSLELPKPVIEGHRVYIDLMHGPQFFNLAKILDKNLVIWNDDEPTIEIYDDWRE